MRWKLLRRRLSVSAPKMIVRSRLPWPLRWAALAVMLGFSAAIALWAFEFGKSIAGLERGDKEELLQLRAEAGLLRQSTQQAQSVANTSESLLKAERAAQDSLASQLRRLDTEKQALQADLGFFERLMPVSGEALQVRGLEVQDSAEPGQLRYRLLLAHSGKQREFSGLVDVVLSGQVNGQPWTLNSGQQPVTVKQLARLEGMIAHPASAVIKTVQARVTDANGALQATRTVKP